MTWLRSSWAVAGSQGPSPHLPSVRPTGRTGVPRLRAPLEPIHLLLKKQFSLNHPETRPAQRGFKYLSCDVAYSASKPPAASQVSSPSLGMEKRGLFPNLPAGGENEGFSVCPDVFETEMGWGSASAREPERHGARNGRGCVPRAPWDPPHVGAEGEALPDPSLSTMSLGRQLRSHGPGSASLLGQRERKTWPVTQGRPPGRLSGALPRDRRARGCSGVRLGLTDTPPPRVCGRGGQPGRWRCVI